MAAAGDEAAHTLYVIKKVRRDGSGKETLLRYYYVLDGLVYEAPTLAAVMRARLLKTAWHLQKAWTLVTAAAGGHAEEPEPAAQPTSRSKRPRSDVQRVAPCTSE